MNAPANRASSPMVGLLPKLRTAETPAWIAPPAPAEVPVAQHAPSVDQVAVELAKREAELIARHTSELAEAKSKVEKDGRARVEKELEASKARYAEAIRALTEAAEEIRGTYSTRTIELALMIAREVLGRELSFDRASLVARVEEALAAIGHEPSIRVRVGTADAAYLLGRRPDLFKSGVELVEDASLATGACFVESSRRVIDASIEVRLSVVRQILEEVSSVAEEGREEVGRAD